MPQMPSITVQLVHIQGPKKGQVDEFSDFPITIGRHSSCHVRFGKELTSISRHHARIESKGNRFRIIDTSTNGTYINGKRIADVYLRDGDVITFSGKGPKASFLTKIGAGSTVADIVPTPSTSGDFLHESNATESSSSIQDPNLTVGADIEIEVLSTHAPLVIQSGQASQSFEILPITIGSDPACDFVIGDPLLSGRQVQIFFSGNNYYIKDLTGKRMVTVNGRPIINQSVLAQGAELSLSDHGPKFRFMGDGQLVEIPTATQDPVEKTMVVSITEPIQNAPSTWQKISKTLFNRLSKKEHGKKQKD